MPDWWRTERGCTCTIAAVDASSDGVIEYDCVDDDCRCTVDSCGCERRWEQRQDEHGPCCETCSEPLCLACRVPLAQCVEVRR
jgi:hypothetical protein